MRLAVTRADVGHRSSLPLKWRMAKRILSESNLKALFVINPSVNDVPSSWYSPDRLARLRYLPDPAGHTVIGSKSNSRATMGLPSTAVVVLVFGSIDERKGIESLIGTLTAESDLEEYVVVVAGSQTAEMRKQMRESPYIELQARNRLIVLDRFLNDTEQGTLFTAADIVWVGYRSHIYMSGVMVLAGRAGLPVIGTVDGEIGRLITKHGLGAVAKIDEPAEVARALRVLRDRTARAEMGNRAQLTFASHTVENFGTSILAAFDTPQAF
jgi:glycosyltransferase involved in cell wall biosynthesis